MTDIFEGPKELVAGAYQDLAELDQTARSFFNQLKYEIVQEKDSHTETVFHKIRLHERLPDIINRRARHVFGDLRSALDMLGFICAVRASNKSNPRGTHFPFGDTRKQIADNLKRIGRHDDIPRSILRLFLRFKPYKGGDDLLWSLNKIANSNKHRIIVPLGRAITGRVGFAFFGMAPVDELGKPIGVITCKPFWDSDKNEIIFAKSSTNAFHMVIYTHASFAITIGEFEVIGGKEICAVLNALACKVQGIITATEARAESIGLIP